MLFRLVPCDETSDCGAGRAGGKLVGDLRFRRALEQRASLTEQSSWIDVLRGSPEAKAAIEELVQIYHSNMDYDDTIHPMYRCVRPALKEI